jgi:hypothetical protein
MNRNLTIMNILFILVTATFFSHPAAAQQTCKDSIISTSPASSFTPHGDGTATDNTTGLMWRRCALGQEWDGKTCSGSATGFTWAEALKTGVLSKFAGHGDWRLPNKNELESIVETRCFLPAANEKIFPATPSVFFWSSSPYAGQAQGAWSVDFGYGTVNASVKTGKIFVRLVRDGE